MRHAQFAVADMVGGRGPRTPSNPVRRHSKPKGQEGRFWQPMSRKQGWQIVDAARRFDRIERKRGEPYGPLGGGTALEVLELFVNTVDFKTGRLDPSLEWIMAKLNRSKAAIVAALKALREYGFLDWLRRYVPTANEGKGPQVQQTSNAYRMSLPARALRLLGRFGRPAPAPDDVVVAQELRAAEIEAIRASLSNEEKAHAIDNPGLAAALARMGRNIDGSKRGV